MANNQPIDPRLGPVTQLLTSVCSNSGTDPHALATDVLRIADQAARLELYRVARLNNPAIDATPSREPPSGYSITRMFNV